MNKKCSFSLFIVGAMVLLVTACPQPAMDDDSVKNSPPSLSVWMNTTVFRVGSSIVFTANANDPERQAVELIWRHTKKPSSSTAVLLTNGNTTELNPDFPGEYTIVCTASDGEEAVMIVKDLIVDVGLFKYMETGILGRDNGTPGNGMQVCIANGHAYLACLGGGLKVFDLTDPMNLQMTAQFGQETWVVHARNDRLYSRGPGGLWIYDISNPPQPVLLGSFAEGRGYSGRFAVSGSLLLADHSSKGLQIINIQDPSAPYEVSSAYSSVAIGVAVQGHHAFVANSFVGGTSYHIQVVDLSDPIHPLIVDPIPVGLWSDDIIIHLEWMV